MKIANISIFYRQMNIDSWAPSWLHYPVPVQVLPAGPQMAGDNVVQNGANADDDDDEVLEPDEELHEAVALHLHVNMLRVRGFAGFYRTLGIFKGGFALPKNGFAGQLPGLVTNLSQILSRSQ